MSFTTDESVAADLSSAEVDLVRAEDRVLVSHNSASVHRALARFEAMASLRLEGYKVNLTDLLRLEAAQLQYPLYEGTNEKLRELMCTEKLCDKPGLLETFRYMQTVEWISKVIKPGSAILPKTLLHIRSRLLYGSVRTSEHVAFRATDLWAQAEKDVSARRSELYSPPPPEAIPSLIEDYCSFVNKSLFSPTAQAGISHFQLESIKPFEGGLDCVERAMSHVIFYRRDLLKSIVSPLAFGPAMATEAHARYFRPYHVGHPVNNLNSFISSGDTFRLCASYTNAAAQIINVYLKTINNLEARWRKRLGRLQKGSTADLLLLALPGTPLVTVNSAMKLVDRGFSSVNDALKLFQDAGIVKLTQPIHKNRAFIAPEAVSIFERLEHRVIPGNPIARDTLTSV